MAGTFGGTNGPFHPNGPNAVSGAAFGTQGPLDKKYLMTDYKHGNTDSNFNIFNKNGEPGLEDDNELGFKKSDSIAMSRTTGIAGFLSPIHVGLHKSKSKNKNLANRGSIDDISD